MIHDKIQRILVIRYRFIGDTILTVPFIRNLRYHYPNAIIDVLVGPQSGEVLAGCPYVNELIPFDTTRFHKYDRGEGKTKNFLSYVFELRKRSYDLVFVLKRSWSSAILAWAVAPIRIGYGTNGRGFLLTKTAPFDSNKHEVESTLDVLRAADIPIIDKHLEAWISPEEHNQIVSKVPSLSLKDKRVLIHAAAAHPDKLYPLESWAEIIKALSNLGMTVYFTGAQQDYALYQQLEDLSQVKCVNLAGKLTLRESMALYKEMNLAVCVDSGPAHLTAAVGTPTISIFGPTNPERWRPYGEIHRAIFEASLPCRPCNYHKTCINRECLTELRPDVIIQACTEVLGIAKNPLHASKQ